MSEPKITKHDILEKTSQMPQKQLYVIQTTPTNGRAKPPSPPYGSLWSETRPMVTFSTGC